MPKGDHTGESSDCVRLWVIPLEQGSLEHGDPSGWSCLLDDRERAQAERFRFEDDRLRYVLAHAALRVILGRRLGVAPRDVRIARTSEGKPLLDAASHPIDLRFSLSHARELALVAVAVGREVGVDVERTAGFQWDEALAHHALPAPLAQELAALPAEERAARFLRTWVRAEAVAKAFGTGLTSLPVPAHVIEARGVTVQDVVPAAGFIGAVAATGPWELICSTYDDEPGA